MTRKPTGHPSADALRRTAVDRRTDAATHAHVAACEECAHDVRLIEVLDQSRFEPLPPCLDDVTIVLAAEGRLEDVAAADARMHLAGCLPCTAMLESLQRTRLKPARARSVASDVADHGRAVIAAVETAVASLAQAVVALATPEMPLSLALVTRSAAATAASPDYQRAMRDYRASRFEVARATLERSLAMGDASASCRFFLGACLRREGRLDAAITHLRDAVALAPSLAEYRWHLAQALLLAGRGDEALPELLRVSKAPGMRKAAAKEQARRLKEVLAGGH